MASKKQDIAHVKEFFSPITDVLALTPVLPGESAQLYQRGLIAAVKELDASTPLQVYLAEKIFECLWWMRRYENQKRTTIIRKMAKLLDTGYSPTITNNQAWAFEVIMENRVDDEDFVKTLDEHNHSLESLTQEAMSDCRGQLEDLEVQIALKAKTLAGFQASYEVLVQRNVNAERLRLQNDLMRRDLQAIEAEPRSTRSSGDSDQQP